ncbi:hypothetical protein [Nevskia sp.]|uniref:hypothetical protein n=1 Tax=Nevskia sp. TaxID=1929292 RepID=UPI0025D03401|nr:hypothetical protein [Nevskia sp.]
MDKSGGGDLSAWQAYEGSAGIAFWSAVSVWMLLLVVAALKPSLRSIVAPVCAVVPLIGVGAWLGLLIA